MTKWEDLESTAVYAMFGMEESLGNVEGAMNLVTEAQENTFGQRWQSFVNSSIASMEPLGKKLLEIAEVWLPKVIAVVEALANWFSNLSPRMQNVVIVLGALAAVAGPLIVIFGSIISAITTMIPIFTTVFGVIGKVGGAFALLSNPIGIAIAAITAIVGSLTILYKTSETVKNAIDTMGRGIINTFKWVYDKVGGFVDGIVGFFKKLGGQKVDVNANVNMNSNLNPASQVSWNAVGGIFTKPTILSTPNAGLQGFGEAGAEAILPLKPDVLAGIGKGIVESMGGIGNNVTVPVYLDGKMIAQVVSNNQYNNASAKALMRGVSI